MFVRLRKRGEGNDGNETWIEVASSTSSAEIHDVAGALMDIPLHLLRLRGPDGGWDSNATVAAMGLGDDGEIVWWTAD